MLTISYCIVGNFRGRKLSQIGEKYDFRGENLLTFAAPKAMEAEPYFFNQTPQIIFFSFSLVANRGQRLFLLESQQINYVTTAE